jgi:hypothetical protein
MQCGFKSVISRQRINVSNAHKRQRRACPKASAPFHSFLLESLNRRTIVCSRIDDDVSPIMFDLRIAIQVGADLAHA